MDSNTARLLLFGIRAKRGRVIFALAPTLVLLLCAASVPILVLCTVLRLLLAVVRVLGRKVTAVNLTSHMVGTREALQYR